LSSLTVKGNYYGAPANQLQYFIWCGASSKIATVSGNTTNTTLPTYVAP
jgi:hypothetical protein